MPEGERVQPAWAQVRVAGVAARPSAVGRVVSAVIDLAGLMPVDVHVGLTEGGPERACDCEPDERMWSCASLDNGWYVFERTLPATAVTDSSEWTVSVRNAAGTGEPVVHTFRMPT